MTIEPSLTNEQLEQWQREVLISYLKPLFVRPFPPGIMTELATKFRECKTPAQTYVVPSYDQAKQVGMCYLLSFGPKRLAWIGRSAYEITKSLYSDNKSDWSLPDFYQPELLIIFYGYDYVNGGVGPTTLSVVNGRSARGKKTLIIMKEQDARVAALNPEVLTLPKPMAVPHKIKTPSSASGSPKVPPSSIL